VGDFLYLEADLVVGFLPTDGEIVYFYHIVSLEDPIMVFVNSGILLMEVKSILLGLYLVGKLCYWGVWSFYK
jgi:hypothetical protein